MLIDDDGILYEIHWSNHGPEKDLVDGAVKYIRKIIPK